MFGVQWGGGGGSRTSRRRPRGPGGVVRGGALGLGGAGFVVVVVRLLGAVIQHEGLGLVGDGDGAGALGPRLPIHLHGHLGALQHQLQRRQHPNVRRSRHLDLEFYKNVRSSCRSCGWVASPWVLPVRLETGHICEGCSEPEKKKKGKDSCY